MKKFLFLIVILLFITAFFFREGLIAQSKYLLKIRPQQYIGATVDMSQLLPESSKYVVNSKGEDLIDLASNLGMNTLRITNITSPTNGTITKSYTQNQWQEVLEKMRLKGMYAVILVESNSQDSEFFSKDIPDSYPDFVRHYVVDSNLCSFSNILAVDIRNEPILSDTNLQKLKNASEIVKSACPTMQVTIGSWGIDSGNKLPTGEEEYYWHDPRAVPLLKDIVDIYSVHIYGFDKPKDGPFPEPYKFATVYLNAIKKYTKKPIFIEEFGAGNGDTLTDQNTLGSPDLQKSTYEGVLKATYDYRNKGVIGATAYLFLPRSSYPESWNIAKDNGDTLLPAAYTFKQYKR